MKHSLYMLIMLLLTSSALHAQEGKGIPTSSPQFSPNRPPFYLMSAYEFEGLTEDQKKFYFETTVKLLADLKGTGTMATSAGLKKDDLKLGLDDDEKSYELRKKVYLLCQSDLNKEPCAQLEKSRMDTFEIEAAFGKAQADQIESEIPKKLPAKETKGKK